MTKLFRAFSFLAPFSYLFFVCSPLLAIKIDPEFKQDSPTQTDLPIPGASSGKGGVKIDPELRKNTPTQENAKMPVISEMMPDDAAVVAAKYPNANPYVEVPPSSPGVRESWRKEFMEKYRAAGGKGEPVFGKLDVNSQPTRQIPLPEEPPHPAKAPGPQDPHTNMAAQTHSSQSVHSENFGKAVGAIGAGMDGLDKAGQIAAGVQKERERSAQDGVDFSGRNAAENVVGSALGADGYNAGKENAKKAIEAADREGRSRWSAAGEALVQTGKDMSGITTAQNVYGEESKREEELAKAEGREASTVAVVGNTAARTAGDKTGLTSVLDASMYDAEADRQAGDAGRRAQEKLKTELEEHLRNTGELEKRMKRLKEREDMTNPSNRQWVRDLQTQYVEARRQAQEINNRTRGKMLNEADPQLIAIRQAVDLLPENPAGIEMNEKELTIDEQVAAHDCSKFPNTKAGWNDQTGVPGCFCVEGFKFNKGETECVPDIAAQVKAKDCSAIAGSVPLWNESSGSAFCGCVQNSQMNAAHTACEPSDEFLQQQAAPITCPYPNSEQAWFRDERMFKCVCKAGFDWDKTGYACVEPRLAQTDCTHVRGTTPYWDDAAGTGMCGCQAGYVIAGNECVPGQPVQSPRQEQPPAPEPPPFDPSTLINTWNQGAASNEPIYNPNAGQWGANGSGGTPAPAQLPGLGPSSGNSGGGTYAGFTGWNGSNGSPGASSVPNSGGVDTSVGNPCVTALGQSDDC